MVIRGRICTLIVTCIMVPARKQPAHTESRFQSKSSAVLVNQNPRSAIDQEGRLFKDRKVVPGWPSAFTIGLGGQWLCAEDANRVTLDLASFRKLK